MYNPFIESSKSGSNIQHSLLALHKENTASQKAKLQGLLPRFMLEYLVILYSFRV